MDAPSIRIHADGRRVQEKRDREIQGEKEKIPDTRTNGYLRETTSGVRIATGRMGIVRAVYESSFRPSCYSYGL